MNTKYYLKIQVFLEQNRTLKIKWKTQILLFSLATRPQYESLHFRQQIKHSSLCVKLKT